MTTAPPKRERVVIVGKTRMGGGVCVGGIIEATGRPVRLLPCGGFCHAPDTAFQVGDIWEMTLRPRPGLQPPHVEDHDEWDAKRIAPMADFLGFIVRAGRPHVGEPTDLFGGMLQFRNTGSAYLPMVNPLPAWSVEFWVLPRPLTHSAFENKHRYRMAGHPGLVVTYVGHETPVLTIPAGTIVRLSLARWWTNPNAPEEGPGCALQLSGWLGVPASAPRLRADPAPPPMGALLDDDLPF